MKKRIKVNSTQDKKTTFLQPGQPVLVRNSNNHPWKIKIFAKEDYMGPNMYQRTHPYKVHNKTNTERTFSFKQCIPVPLGLLPVWED